MSTPAATADRPPEPSLWANIEQTAHRYAETKGDPRARLKLTEQIKASLDITQSQDVDVWLKHMFPVLTRALAETRPGFTEVDVEHRLRSALLDVLNRLPQGDSLRPYAPALCAVITRVLAQDNEDNAVTCIRILFECHKHYHPTLEAEVGPFVTFFTSLFTSFENNCRYHFNEQFNQLYNSMMAQLATSSASSITGAQPAQGQAGQGQAQAATQLPLKVLCKSSESIKVCYESPLVLMMLLQNYPRLVEPAVPGIIPLVIRALSQVAPKEPPPLPAALVNLLTSPSTSSSDPSAPSPPVDEEKAQQDRATLRALERERDSRFRVALSDFYTAQVKSLSFIAYLYRGYAQHISPHQETLAACVVQLLVSCPGDFPVARKDLLVAIRHVLLSDFRRVLLRKTDKLLDEKVLIGEGSLVYHTLRPLAYATLQDVVHHVKQDLTLPQLSKVVYVFSRNVHDTTLPLSVQTSAVRMLMTLVDMIHRAGEAGDGRHNGRSILVRILYTLTAKCEALQAFIPRLDAHLQRNSAQMLAKMEENVDRRSGVVYPTSLTLSSPATVSSGSKGEEEVEDVIKELKTMLSTMIMGLKTVVYCCKESKVLGAQGKKYPVLMEEEEIAMVGRLLDNGLRCFKLYSLSVPPHLSSTPTPHGHDEKDVIDGFATIFTMMEQRAFREVFTLKMDVLFQAIVDNPRSSLMFIPQHFLGSNVQLQNNSGGAALNQAQIGRVFADILLTFLVKRLKDMTVPFTDSPQSATYVHLFRHVFASVEVNDVVLRPYIGPIVTSILRLVTEVKNPINYFAILRALFRSIGGGKFELLYKEFLPTLPDLVGTLMRMQSKGPAVTREIALELSLTLPARLSSLLPYIPILIRAVLRAFQAKEDTIVKLGLRTLDFWVDNLNPDYLYPHCRPILAELFTGLCALLKPSPQSSYGSQALSVLGKFGGKNRRFLIEALDLQWKERKEDGLLVQAQFASLGPGREENEGFDLPLGKVIEVAGKVIAAASATHSYANTAAPPVAAEPLVSCYYLARTCLLALIDTSGDVNAVWVDGGWKKYRPFNADWQAEQAQLAADAQRRKEEADKEKQRKDKEAANRQRDKDKDKSKRRKDRAKTDAEAEKDAAKGAQASPTPAVPPPTLLPSLGDEEIIALRRRLQSSCSHATFRTLLTSVLSACADPTLHRHGTDAVEFVRGLCVHFASVSAVARTRGFKEEGREIDSSVFVEAVVECMCEEEQARREVALSCLTIFLQSLIHLVGVEAAGQRPIIADLLAHLCHCCHLDRWEAKQAGAIGLSLLCRTLSPSWLINAQMELIKSLMATFVDDKTEHTEQTAEKVTETLHLIVDCTCQAARDALKGEAKEAVTAPDVSAEAEERKGVESSVMEVLDDEKESKEVVREVKAAEKAETKEAPVEEKSSEEREMDLHMQTDDDSKAPADATPAPPAAAPPPTAAPSASVTSATSRPVLDERKSPMLRHLIAVVAPCLISNVSAMRAAAQSLLSFISRSMNRSLFDLLYPHREHLLQHVYSKGLHQVSIAVRIGHLSAATYLLTLQPHPLVSVKELSYLVKLVMEVVDEEQQLAGNFNSRTGRQQLWTRLRVESLQLMSAALAHEEVRRDPKSHKDWKESIIRVFFRSLLSRTSQINSAAKNGLRQVIEREKIPKDLLQTCLRPILLNLADHRKLTVALLEGLARLLELLSSCFNVTLGEKLLDHLRNFASMESLSRMREEALNDKSGTLIKLKPEEEVKIPLCVIELFHLLPPAPEGKFLEALVASVMKLEEVLPMLMCGGLATLPASQLGFNLSIIDSNDSPDRAFTAAKRTPPLAGGPGVSSPYRLPLLKFLNKHPRKSLEYLFRNLHRKRVSALLLSLLKYPEAEPLRRYLFEHQDFLDMWTFHYDKATAEQSLMPPAQPQQPPNQQGQQPPSVQPQSNSAAPTDPSTVVPPPSQSDAGAATQSAGGMGAAGAAANGLPPLENPSAPIASDGSRAPPTSSTDVNMTQADQSQSQSSGAAPAASSTLAPPLPPPGVSAAVAPGSQPSKESEALQRQAQQTAMEQEERIIQGINLVHVLSTIQPDFITQRMLSCLVEVWDSKGRIGRLLKEEQLPIHYVEESRTLVQCLLTYSNSHREDVNCLWKLLSAFRLRSLVDFTFLAEQLDVELNASYSLTEKRFVLRQLLRYVENPGTSQPTKSRAFKHVIRPMIKHSLKLRTTRSQQAVREEQLRIVEERKARDGDRKETAEAEKKEAKEVDIGAAAAPSTDSRQPQQQPQQQQMMELDEKGGAAEALEESASYAAAVAEANLILPPVWLDDDLLDTDMTDSIVHTFTAEHLSSTQDEDYRQELLRLAVLLLTHLSPELHVYRNKLWRFLSVHLQSDNLQTKLWAYVAAARWIASYPCPAKVVIQIFTALLRMHGTEGKYLVNKALDILIPALPERLPADHHKYSAWLKWTKKILTEEGHTITLAIHIYSALIRHAPLFHPARVQFIPQMINYLSKIGLTNRGSLEHRKLAVQMAELIVAWDQQAKFDHSAKMELEGTTNSSRPAAAAAAAPGVDVTATPAPAEGSSASGAAEATAVPGPVPVPVGPPPGMESPSKRQAVEPMQVDSNSTAPPAVATAETVALPAPTAPSVAALPPLAPAPAPPPPPNPWLLIDSTGSSPQLVELLLTFLFRLALMTCDAAETRPLSKRIVRLIKDACLLWKDTGADIKWVNVEKMLQNVQPNHDTTLLHTTTFELLTTTLTYAAPQQMAAVIQPPTITFIDRMLITSISAKLMTPALRDGITETLSLISSHYPMAVVAPSAELSKMYKTIRDTVVSALKSIEKVPSLFIHMSLLTVITKTYPAFVVSNLPFIIKALTKLTKDVLTRQQHVMAHHQALMNHSRSVMPLTQEEKMKALLTNDSLRRCLSLCYEHVAALGEHRKAFLQSLTYLIEKSNDLAMLSELAKQLDGWMTNESVLTPKEKCLLLSKMTVREREKGYGEVLAQVLQTALTLFRERKVDWLGRLQRVFMLGLRAEDPSLRHQFESLLTSSLQPTLPDRLYYTFVTQDWEVISDGYWISEAVQLLLDIVRRDRPLLPLKRLPLVPSFDYHWMDGAKSVDNIRSPGHGRRINVREVDDNTRKRSRARAFGETDNEAKKEESKEDESKAAKLCSPASLLVPEQTRSGMLSTYLNWLHTFGDVSMADLLDVLTELSFYHIPIAHEMFIRLFSAGWTQLSSAQRSELSPAVSALLAKPWHSRWDYEGWNKLFDKLHPVQTLLSAIHATVPPIHVAPELVRYAGKTFNGWHTAVDLLEQRLQQQQQASLDSALQSLTLSQALVPSNGVLVAAPPSTPQTLVSTFDALCQLYRDLNEDDLWFGAWRRRASNDYSLSALAHEQFGNWQRAQDALYLSMQRCVHEPVHDLPSHKAEQAMWESEWVSAAKHLNQWEVLKDFSVHVGMVEVQLDAVWRLGEWTALKDLVSRYKDSDLLQGKLYHVYHALHERKTSTEEMTKLIDNTVQSGVLREWQALPSVIRMSHLPLLQRAQRITELMESTMALDDIGKAARQGLPSLPNLKNFISTWRERLPNAWEDVTVWSDILVWRSLMFNILAQSYNAPAEGQGYRMNDSPWTIIKLAATARKQLLPSVCLTALAKLFTQSSPPLSTDDSFNKLREHVKTLLLSPQEMSAALNIITATNLDYFQPEQKAEMFRLKGEALQHLGYGDESNTAFSACLSICDHYGKGWLSWGAFCDRVFSLKKDIQWADHSCVCYIQAISHKYKKAYPMVARILWLLSFDKDGGPVNRAFARFHEHIPTWVWLMWIPQLLSALARYEGQSAKQILCKIARTYPQALYYTVRCFLLERRDANTIAQQTMQARQHRQMQLQQIQQQQQQQHQQQQPAQPELQAPHPPQPVPAAASDTSTAVPVASGVNGAGSTSAVVTAVGSGADGPAPMEVESASGAAPPPSLAAPTANGTSATPSQLATAPPPASDPAAIRSESKEAPSPAPPGPGGQQQQQQQSTASAPHGQEQGAAATPPSNAAAPPSAAVADVPRDENMSMTYLEEVINVLRRAHPSLMTEVERMLDELSRRFRVEPEEELLSNFHALIGKSYKQPLLAEEGVPPLIQTTLERVYRTYFVDQPAVGTSSAKRYAAFVQAYKPRFEFDFVRNASAGSARQFPTSLQDLLVRFQRWKAHLHFYLASHPQLSSPRLERLSSYLVQFSSHDIEVPGQYMHDREPILDHHVILSRFSPEVAIPHASTGSFHRRIGVVGDDGRPYYFLMHFTVSHITRCDERLMQLYTLLNRLMKQHKQTRQRQLVYHVPIVVPITSRSRLSATHPSTVTLEEVYESACHAQGLDPAQPLMSFRDTVAGVPGADSDYSTRLRLYNDICTVQVPDTLLSSFLHRSHPSLTPLFAFKLEFARQLALAGYLTYLLKIGDRNPSRISFHQHSARVINTEFYPHYNEQHIVEGQEPVPFRLTRNLTAFLGPAAVDGSFASVLQSVNGCLFNSLEALRNFMSLFYRDDVVSFSAARLIGVEHNDAGQRLIERQLKDKVQLNVNNVAKRLHVLMPVTAPVGKEQQQAGGVAGGAAAGGGGAAGGVAGPIPSHHKVSHMIKIATAKSKLCMMPPTWAPWF